MSQRGHAPRHGGPAMAGEKAKNFKGSSKRLLKYLRPFWVPVIFVMLFAAASTVFSIVGPKVLALATDELANGLVRIVTGAQGGIDFGYIGKVLLLLGDHHLCVCVIGVIDRKQQGAQQAGQQSRNQHLGRFPPSESHHAPPPFCKISYHAGAQKKTSFFF